MGVRNVTLNDLGNVLATPFMTPYSRSLIKAGWVGDIETFSKKLCECSWQRMRDYTLVVIMLAVIVAASKAKKIKVSARQYNADGSRGVKKDKNKREEIPLPDYIKRKVNSFKLEKLFTKVLNIEDKSNVGSIVNSISREGSPHGWFARCFVSLAAYHDEGKSHEVFTNFINRVKKIKPWSKHNRKYLVGLANTVNILLQTDVEVEPTNEVEGEKSRIKLRLKKRHTEKTLEQVSDELAQYLQGKDKRGGFVVLSRPTETLRGWKLHISPKPVYVMEALKVLESIMKKYACEIKCCESLGHYMNEMIGDQAGKFMTIYPDSDEQAGRITEEIHKGLGKAGLSGESYFMKIKNDFEVYPGIYARFCDYVGGAGRNSRYRSGIPPKVLKAHLSALKITAEDYVHPFKKLSLNGLVMPKNVNEINDFLMDNVISKSTWETLTDLSQIPDNSDFEFSTPFANWKAVPPEELVAVAKVTLPRHANFKIVFVPRSIEKHYLFQFGRQKGYIYPRVGHTLISNLLKCLESGNESVRVKTVPLVSFNPSEKNKIRVLKHPKAFLNKIQYELEKLPIAKKEE